MPVKQTQYQESQQTIETTNNKQTYTTTTTMTRATCIKQTNKQTNIVQLYFSCDPRPRHLYQVCCWLQRHLSCNRTPGHVTGTASQSNSSKKSIINWSKRKITFYHSVNFERFNQTTKTCLCHNQLNTIDHQGALIKFDQTQKQNTPLGRAGQN